MIRLHCGDKCVLIRQSKRGAAGEPVECVRARNRWAEMQDIDGRRFMINDAWFRQNKASLFQITIDNARSSL
ncbi:MAG: hypothetical protein LBL46_02875 [Rickettsiales bacterium]|jgi:SH3-like domain-containing protein|nr:hypothetical protein [Rickettsiales bacterium]